MTLQCSNSGSFALKITSQSYHGDSAFEAYECEDCGATGSLDHDGRRATLRGHVESGEVTYGRY